MRLVESGGLAFREAQTSLFKCDVRQPGPVWPYDSLIVVPKALIFDFDGTLTLSEPVHMSAWIEMARQHSLPLPEGFLEAGIGHTDREDAEILAQSWGQTDPQHTGVSLLAEKRATYRRKALTESVLVDGVPEMLAHFSRIYPLGLATSASYDDINPTLERYDLGQYFKSVVAIEDVHNGKPDPEIYLKSAQILGVDPSACVAFEDTIIGGDAARAAGMRVIGITTTFTERDLGKVIGAIRDFRDLSVVEGLLLGP